MFNHYINLLNMKLSINTKKLFLLSITSTLLLFSSLKLNAQKDFQGQAIYQTKTTLDMSSWGSRAQQMSEQQKKMIALLT